jgi:acyl-CoA synthetase (AMP-forming)/AMP-acid ligase II/acyl carrier protein
VNLLGALRARSSARPDAIAHVVAGGETLSFRQWDARAQETAAALRSNGIGAGHQVGIRHGAEEFVAAAVGLVAVHLVGAVPIVFPHGQSVDELNLLSSEIDVDAFLPDAVSSRAAATAGPPREAPLSWRLRLHADAGSDSETAVVVFTSGSTGTPKAVAVTQLDLLYNANDRWSDAVLLHGSTMHTIDGATNLVSPLRDGKTVITLPDFSPEGFWQQVAKHRPSYVKLVPSMVRLLAGPSRVPRPDAAQAVERVWLGSASVSPEDVQLLADMFPHADVYSNYSSTESGHAGVSCQLAAAGSRDPSWLGELGRPGTDTRIRIVDDEGRPVPTSTVGHIQLRHTILPRRSYFPVSTHHSQLPASDRDWVPMGDLGRIDDEDRLWFHARIAETANCGGENVSLIEVEQAFHEHPSVADAAAVALPHPVLGEAIGMVVVPRDGHAIAEGALKAFARSRLSTNKQPMKIVLAEGVPRTSNGKISRAQLRKWFDTSTAPSATAAVAFRSSVLELVRAKGMPTARQQDSLFALGFDSLDLVVLVDDIEHSFGVRLDFADMFAAHSIDDLALLVDSAIADSPEGI